MMPSSKPLGLLLFILTFPATLVAAPISDTTHPSFLVLSDVHLDWGKQQSGISPLARDGGTDTWIATQHETTKLITDPTIAPHFILYLGDLPAHGSRATITTTLNDAGKVLADLRELATQNHIPLLYVPGNNDSPDGDYGPFSIRLFHHDPDSTATWPVIGAPALAGSESLFNRIGCYSAYPLGPEGKLRVIVLNTVLFTWNYRSPGDSAECQAQIDWLGQQLRQTRAKGEMALIVMHVPPGFDTFRHKTFWTTRVSINHTTIQNCFLDTLDHYKNHVMGVLSSHTHMDGFKRFYNKKGQFITLLISVPAVAPSLLNNSALKLIRYDHKLQFTSSVTYYLAGTGDQWHTNTVATAPLAAMGTAHFKQVVVSLYNTGKAIPDLFGPDLDVRRSAQ
jgi:sphingomyelin phosphodiesterase acid-like 3